VALKLFIDNWRWSGVPFYLRTGKRLPKRASEVAIQFKDVPKVLFNDRPDVPLEPTLLSLRIQPEEGMSMRIASKLPGPKVRIYPVKMEFNYSASFGGTSPEAYERLLLDVMAGDATLFMRRDAVEAAWPVLHADPEPLGEDAGARPAGVPVRHLGARSRPTASSSRTGGSGGRYDRRGDPAGHETPRPAAGRGAGTQQADEGVAGGRRRAGASAPAWPTW